MANIADGIEVIRRKDSKGKWAFAFHDLRPRYKNPRSYNIVVLRNNKIVESSEDVLARFPQISPTILGGEIPNPQYQATQIFPSGEGVYEMTLDPETGQTGWISREEEEEEDRREERRNKGWDSDDD